MKPSESKRAIGLMVALIILIAVVVLGAVGTEMLAFMGALPYVSTRNGGELTLGPPFGWHGDGSTVNITVSCTGNEAFTVVKVLIDEVNYTFQWAYSGSAGWLPSPAGPVSPRSSITLEIQYLLGWSSGYSYTFVIVTEKNYMYQTTGTCPL